MNTVIHLLNMMKALAVILSLMLCLYHKALS